jgi:hypothetical protein
VGKVVSIKNRLKRLQIYESNFLFSKSFLFYDRFRWAGFDWQWKKLISDKLAKEPDYPIQII